MAMKDMLPYREEIIAMKELPNAKTHEDIIDHLSSSYGIQVSKPTISRFLQQHAPHLVNSRKLSADEERTVIPFEAFLRVESEINGLREELGVQIETLTERVTRQLIDLSGDVAELKNRSSHQATDTKSIWIKAVFLSLLLSPGIAALLFYLVNNQ